MRLCCTLSLVDTRYVAGFPFFVFPSYTFFIHFRLHPASMCNVPLSTVACVYMWHVQHTPTSLLNTFTIFPLSFRLISYFFHLKGIIFASYLHSGSLLICTRTQCFSILFISIFLFLFVLFGAIDHYICDSVLTVRLGCIKTIWSRCDKNMRTLTLFTMAMAMAMAQCVWWRWRTRTKISANIMKVWTAKLSLAVTKKNRLEQR